MTHGNEKSELHVPGDCAGEFALMLQLARQALYISTLPGRARSAKNFVDVHDFDLLSEFLTVDPITIS